MKRLFTIPLIIMLFGIAAYSQTNEKPVCPSISITNPPERVNPGEVMTFTANITGLDLQDHEIVWSIDKGRIIQGQGTPILIVDSTGLSQEAIIAEVKLKGIRGGCRNSAIGFGTISSGIRIYDLDEFGDLPDGDIEARIDSIAGQLEEDKFAKVYIINYGSSEKIDYRKTLVTNYFSLRNIQNSRYEFVDGGEENSIRTRIFIKSCPGYKIKGPETSIDSEKPMIFFIEEKRHPMEIYSGKYEWKVSQGKIIQGQGTDMIVVDVTNLSDETVTATLEIEGLPEKCGNKFSETGKVSGVTIGEPLDYFENIKANDVRDRIDLLIATLKNQSDLTMGYIVQYGQAEDVRRREALIRNHLKFRKFDVNRIVFQYRGEEEEIRTRIWIAYEGSDASSIY